MDEGKDRTQARATGLDYVFHPRSVAVVGVSRRRRGFAAVGTTFLTGLKEMGFPALFPVNPKYEEVEGLKCYPSILDIEGPLDHVISNVPASVLPHLVDECIAKGVRCIHFFTAGFRETGDQRRADLELELVARARQAGIRVLGPNCMGLYVPASKLTFGDGFPSEAGPVAMISQSGGNAHGMVYAAAPRGIRFSKVVSYGNAADINESELLDYLAEDPETEIIGAYIEGIKDGQRFLQAMRRAASVKPLVVLKGGRTQSGTKAVRSHTGSLAGSNHIFEVACRQATAIQVQSVEEMVDVVVALRYVGVPRGPRVAVVGGGGGLSVFAADQVDEAGLTCPTLPESVQDLLRQFTPAAGTSVRNPVDAVDILEPKTLGDALDAAASAENIDLVLCHASLGWGAARLSGIAKRLDAVVAEMSRVREAAGKPVVVAMAQDRLDVEAMQSVQALQDKCCRARVAFFSSIPRACGAVAKVLAWDQARSAGAAE
jgi:acyl-CoA synthetase (NDP forming)